MADEKGRIIIDGELVGFSTNPGSIEVGAMVADPKNNKQAVYCGNNKWTLIQ